MCIRDSIDLDALHGVRSVAVNQVGAGIEREMRESLLIFLGHVLIARAGCPGRTARELSRGGAVAIMVRHHHNVDERPQPANVVAYSIDVSWVDGDSVARADLG